MNKIWESLNKLGLTSEKTVQLFSSETRDRKNLKVYRDTASGVIFIRDYYVGNKSYILSDYIKDKPVSDLAASLEDKRNAERRTAAFRHYAWGKDICDFGCGAGFFFRKCDVRMFKCSWS